MLINSAFIKSYGLVMSLLMIWVMLQMPQAEARVKNKAAPLSSLHSGMPPKQEMSEHTDDLRALMLQLYTDHPEELAKSTQVGPREMTEWVFDGKANWKFDAIRRTQQAEAIALVFDPGYTGDHILALVVGLETLLFNAYGGKNEYEIAASVDEKPVLQVACQLESLRRQLDANTKQVAILSQAYSRQHIQQTVQTIIQRIRAPYSGQQVANSNC